MRAALVPLAALATLLACSSPPPPPAPEPSTAAASLTPPSSAAPTTAGPSLTGGAPAGLLGGAPVLAVKIDNTAPARPRVGLDRADIVYVEPVEAGLTRLLAVFSSSLPPTVGPVRSARESDLDLLANYGRVAFAYSGGSPTTLATLARGHQVGVSADVSAQGFRRERGRAAPFNLMGDPAALLARAGGSAAAGDLGWRIGAAPAGGTPATRVATAYPLARLAFTWDPATRRYLLTTDGRPEVTADGVRVGAATVLVQTVRTRLTDNRDALGARTPAVEVVGTGPATLLRDGLAFTGTWSRPTPSAPTSLTTSSGAALTMSAGPLWVLLVPVAQSVSVEPAGS